MLEVLYRLGGMACPVTRIDLVGVCTFIEVGVHEADLTSHVLSWFPRIRVIAIDPWKPYHTDEYSSIDMKYGKQKWANAESRARIAIRTHGRGRAKIIKATSDAAAPQIPANWAHMVFLDGLHTKKQLVQDIELYWDKLRPGGIMGGHDLDRAPGVRKALEHIGRPFEQGFGATWWYEPKIDGEEVS